jgi:archaetidylinositol phosphate synthase
MNGSRRSTIRDFFYPLLTPFARRLAGLSPNTISVIALVAGLAAGGCYWATRWSPWFYLAGAALVIISGLGDCFDGIVARETGRETVFGDFLDHFFDRIVNMAIFAGLAFSPTASPSLGLSVAILILLNSYLGTQIQASFGSRDYSGFGKAQLFIALVVGSLALFLVPAGSIRLAGLDISLLDALFGLIGLATLQAIVHRVRLAVRLSATAEGNDGD